MTISLLDWAGLYEAHKDKAVCLDIETDGICGRITVVGFSRCGEGEIDYTGLVLDRDLGLETVATALRGAGLLITFNGVKHDLPRLRAAFPELNLASIPVLDLYLIAKRLGLKARLTTLEAMFGISRPDPRTARHHIATRLWRRWVKFRDPGALDLLVAYNRQDTINLYPLAEALMGLVRRGQVSSFKSRLSRHPRRARAHFAGQSQGRWH